MLSDETKSNEFNNVEIFVQDKINGFNNNNQKDKEDMENISNEGNNKLKFNSEYSQDHKIIEEKLLSNLHEKTKEDFNEISLDNNVTNFNLLKQAISVSNPTKKEGIKSYIVYTIKLKNRNDAILRRFSDFFLLREKLIIRWPGVYIPNIPPKITVVRFFIFYLYK